MSIYGISYSNASQLQIKEMQISIQQDIKGYLLKDARHLQILFLGIFLIYGLSFLDWQPQLSKYVVNFSVCLLTQAVCLALVNRPWFDLKSAVITSLSLSLLLQTQVMFVAALSAVLAIASKFVIRYKNKHVFNPANFGIILTLLLTKNAWIDSGQWGHSYLLVVLLGVQPCLKPISPKCPTIQLTNNYAPIARNQSRHF